MVPEIVSVSTIDQTGKLMGVQYAVGEFQIYLRWWDDLVSLEMRTPTSKIYSSIGSESMTVTVTPNL